MPASMTAFASCTRDLPNARLCCEIRAVNHRYLELALKLPEDFRAHEAEVRERITRKVKRGKVDLQLRIESQPGATGALRVNRAVLDAVIDACHQVQGVLGQAHTPGVIDLLRWPGVVEADVLEADTLLPDVEALIEETLDDFVAGRRREGTRIAAFMTERLDDMARHVTVLREKLPLLVQHQRERLLARIADLGVNVDPGRVEQEVALLAQRADVAEEVDRLDTHITEVRRLLEDAEPIGRKLDFLMQELNRESNTLGSKSQALESTAIAVELKVLIEQMREQVQNVE
jgi:uncharacterized protein (TIGR00255 family)